ncbi:MAG: aminomethyl-transferring glycine dehydrogenase subunit GcvPB [Spirochaetales bacterium]|nr:aminomethyl-transferring glycine dehydrogenase subunit GcvPB [Spirochaetales bacterium]
MKLLFEKSKKNRPGTRFTSSFESDRPGLAQKYFRSSLDLPELSEPEVMRHYTALSKQNIGVDNAFYPLGSCTMKYNPRINEQTSRFEGFASSHPLFDASLVQGNLALMVHLADALSAITGLPGITLAPAAGAHGELTGLMIMKKYFTDKGEKRTKIIAPDSSHGTNPASASMCGFTTISLKSNKDGMVDISALRELMDKDVAGLMMTNPNTLGVFDKNIEEITRIIHEAGGLVYGDGANANALLGKTLFSKMGFDIIHLNLHKTFSTPHGGGGPGAGPVAVTETLKEFLPGPLPVKNSGTYSFQMPKKSIGRIRSFFGNFGVLVRAYTYICSLGRDGLSAVSDHAVLNAEYVKALLKDYYHIAYDSPTKHEFVLDDTGLPNGVTTMDIAKRLLDYGFHPPTVYFPLIVHGALMIEPTETESKETLEEFADALIAIRQEAATNPDMVKNAPHTTPVFRLDEVMAARKPDLCYTVQQKG